MLPGKACASFYERRLGGDGQKTTDRFEQTLHASNGGALVEPGVFDGGADENRTIHPRHHVQNSLQMTRVRARCGHRSCSS